MIVLFTDFGAEGPYLGQMEAVLRVNAPGEPVINLLSNAPTADPRRAAYLLAALCREFPEGSVFVCVVDPGVGGERQPVVLNADGRWFVGPDNGLLNTVAVQAQAAVWHAIDWRPKRLSASFHGRDLFAPVAAKIACGDFSARGPQCQSPAKDWPADIAELIYVDHYGNAITGYRYGPGLDGKVLRMTETALIEAHDGESGVQIAVRLIPQARTFCEMPVNQEFWYCNSMGLVEIAVNQGRAEQLFSRAMAREVSFSFEPPA